MQRKFSLLSAVLLILAASLAHAQPSGAAETFSKNFNSKFCDIAGDPLSRRVFEEYGAIYAADRKVILPTQCIFANEEEVAAFQKTVRTITSYIGRARIELQEPAMQQLINAVAEAEAVGLRIMPLDGSIAGKRTYVETGRLWNSRFHRALDHWVRQGRIDPAESDVFRWQPFRRQAEQVLKWESADICFSTDFSRSIFASTAPPGASQHLAMLAFDVVQYADPRVRRILNDHGWFQTVLNDAPHFTFLGVNESDLPARGLKNIIRGGQSYWVPNMPLLYERHTAAAK